MSAASAGVAMPPADFAQHRPRVSHGLDHVPGPGLALGPDHGRPFADPPQCLAEIPTAADERDREVVLPDVVLFVGRRQDLGLVDVIHPQGLQDLRLDEVADPALGHDRDGYGPLDLLDDGRVRHAGHAPRRPDIGGDPLQRHDGAGAGVLGDLRMLRRYDIHDHPALQHLGETNLHRPGSLLHDAPPSCSHSSN